MGVKGRWGSAALCSDLGKGKYIFIGLQWLLHVYLEALNTGICFLTIMGGVPRALRLFLIISLGIPLASLYPGTAVEPRLFLIIALFTN